jgi:hypothetical protein
VPVGEHEVSQLPQSPSSVRKSDSQLFAFVSQSPKFGRHSSSLQVPASQRPVAFAEANTVSQSRLHVPQFASSAALFVSQPVAYPPSDAVASQFDQPLSQPMTRHSPSTQAPVPFDTVQARPHIPQFIGSTSMFVSQPFM